MENFNKIVRIGELPDGNAFAKIEFKDGKLSISGAIGPKSNGDCTGSCGQWNMAFKECDERGHLTVQNVTPAPGWTTETVWKFLQVWDQWHLNDMRANCQHQTGADWNTSEKIELVTYSLNSEGHALRRAAETEAGAAARENRVANLTDTGRALLGDWWKDRHTAPDADSPLSGLYEVSKRETKTAGWVYPSQHPRGLLTKPCSVCGYKYGSAWLKEAVPADVLEFLRALPNTDITPAWV
jgi:hypothetical protein